MCSLRGPTGALPLSADAPVTVGRATLGDSHGHVSRKQATVAVDAQGRITVESHGTNATGVRSGPEAEWQWLFKGDAVTVAHGAQLCLDKKATQPEALLTLHCAAPDLNEPTAASAPVPAAAAPAEWLWQSSIANDEWRPFPVEQVAAIEAAHAAGKPLSLIHI